MSVESLQKRVSLVFNFSCVCPEPVLANVWFFSAKWHRKKDVCAPEPRSLQLVSYVAKEIVQRCMRENAPFC